MNATERRYTKGLVELRADGGRRSIGGYAAKFNVLSQNLGGFVERIDPGFFNKSLADALDVLARYNHDDNMLLGRTSSGTLQLAVDGTGLDYTVEPPSARADVVELVERGDVMQSSFAFRLAPDGDEWGYTEQGFPLRTLVAGQLVDVAPVNSPAYLDTTTGLRALAEARDADLDDVVAAAKANDLRRFITPTPTVIDLATSGQGATHPPLALRQRRAELYRRRAF